MLTLRCELNHFSLIHYAHMSKTVNMASSFHCTETETKALLSIWGTKQIQSELDGVVRNKNIYEEHQTSLKSDVSRNWKQCRDHVKNLLAKYRKVKGNNRQTGNNRQNCPFYKEMDSMVGTRSVSMPPNRYSRRYSENSCYYGVRNI